LRWRIYEQACETGTRAARGKYTLPAAFSTKAEHASDVKNET
jgi:hypothetical protein